LSGSRQNAEVTERVAVYQVYAGIRWCDDGAYGGECEAAERSSEPR